MGRHRLIEAVRARGADEVGTIHRRGRVNVALCYPSAYHLGMSSLGFQTIYRAINDHPEVAAERVFLPDDVDAFRDARLLPISEETQRPLSQFDVIAFSVAYELELTGLFALLSLAGLPAERGTPRPLVVAGGPLTFSNPAPLEPFVDVLVQGEADDTIHQLLDVVLEIPSTEAQLHRLSQLPGFRVPGRSGSHTELAVHRAPDHLLPAHSQIITPHTELRSMFLIEPARGCSRGCHYCVMRRTTNGGMRTVSAERVLNLIPPQARRVGLVGAAVTDHPELTRILRELVDGGREVGVSSLRADRLNSEVVGALAEGGAQVLTVASDGASQRLRDLVDRKHSEEQLLRAAQLGKDAGFRRLKVYNLVGLPGEEDSDIHELARFTGELSRILPTALGVAPFVAKRHTPLDGAPFAGIEVVEERLRLLRRLLKGRAEVRPTSARWAWVEYMLAQCGPSAGLAALDAWRAGGTFAAWREAFKARSCVPFEAHRTFDGRRAATSWPSVGSHSGAPEPPVAA